MAQGGRRPIAKPRVTVVVPAHNVALYIEATLESISCQTMTGWRAVVVDDASTDETADIASRFAHSDRRFRVIRLDHNRGPAGARNEGIVASEPTQLIALLDADDWWDPEYLTKQLERYDAACAQGRKVGIVACDAHIVGPHGPTGYTWFDRRGWIDPIEYESMLERSYIFVSAVFPRAAWEEVGGFAEDCWGSEDYDLWMQLLEHGYEAIATREPLATYRLHENSLTHSRRRAAQAAITAYERALRRGPATSERRRMIKRELRHYRAVRDQAIALEALRAGRSVEGGVLLLRALPSSAVAVAQRPARWMEWLSRLAASVSTAR